MAKTRAACVSQGGKAAGKAAGEHGPGAGPMLCVVTPGLLFQRADFAPAMALHWFEIYPSWLNGMEAWAGDGLIGGEGFRRVYKARSRPSSQRIASADVSRFLRGVYGVVGIAAHSDQLFFSTW